ncbi:MAG TPA: hypothetical protein VLJ37_07400 [bacterium]|nr:hypothetical protein [bacterium]
MLGLLAGCPIPAVSPTTAGPEGTTVSAAPAAVPAPSPLGATKEEGPSEEEAPPPEAGEQRIAEASPTWMAPTDGFIGCHEALWAEASVSLEDGAAMETGTLGVNLKVRNPETGEEEPLEDHSIAVETRISLPDGLLEGIGDAFRSGAVHRVGEGSGEIPPGPTSLKVTLILTSTRPTDPSVRDACTPERAFLRGKTFALHGAYRRGLVPYSGHEDFQLAADESLTPLEKMTLTRTPLSLPEGAVLKGPLKGRLTR